MEVPDDILVNQSNEANREQAIANIYTHLAHVQMDDAHDAYAAARALNELADLEASGWGN